MRFDFGLLLGIALECLFFIYYANSVFELKRNKYICYAVTILGYAVNLVSCMFFVSLINISLFTMVNFFLLISFYYISCKSAILQSVLLSLLVTAGELFVVFIEGFHFDIHGVVAMTSMQSLEITVIGKLIYLIGIMIFIHLTEKINDYKSTFPVILIFVPMITVICIILMWISSVSTEMLSYITILLLAINIIMFSVYQSIVKKSDEMLSLKDRLLKEQVDISEYTLLKEKYHQMQIFHHDFKEQMNTLNGLLLDNNNQAKKYIKNICATEEILNVVEYTDNKILNILLNRKKEECANKEIKLKISPIFATLNFFSDSDTVSIFSNLINNAIEGCEKSTEKNIYLDIYTVNDVFLVIKVKNNADVKPIVYKNTLRTSKRNTDDHGIGISSIIWAINKYAGEMQWRYDDINRIFEATIMINTHLSNFATR